MRKLAMVLLCAACGDNVLVDPEGGGTQPPTVDPDPNFEIVEPHLVPQVCVARTWPQIAVDPTADLAVAVSTYGVTVFAANGGDLLGWHFDHAGELQTTKAGTPLRTGAITGVSAAFVDERMITASVGDDGVTIDMIRHDLGVTNLETTPGQLIADVPVTHVRADRFTAIADASGGITGIRFASDWKPSDTQPLASKDVLSITAAPYRDDTLVAWSTKDTCHLARVAAERTSTRPFACVGARLAMNAETHRGFLVYDDGANIMIGEIRIGAESELANTRILARDGHAPKITFDGSRFWVSYLDARADIVIGYIDDKGSLVSMAVEGTQPLRAGHELVIHDGVEVWLYAVDAAGLGAQRFCLKAI